MTQEILRVLRNCSRRLPWSEVCAHVETYLARMQYSGYHRRFRTEVVRSALNAYDKMVERDEEGVEPLYRPRGWNECRELRGEGQRKETGSKEVIKGMKVWCLYQQHQVVN